LFFFYRQAKDTRKDKKRKKREIGEGNKEEREREGLMNLYLQLLTCFLGFCFSTNKQKKRKERRSFELE